jgi:hypothetical protein
VSDQKNTREFAQLQHVNSQLIESLARCRDLPSECRSQLVANSNEAPSCDASLNRSADER